jgi:uncharacterized membrane protein YtjA (UPF0391 family)
MIRSADTVSFTEEDRQSLTVYHYTEEEKQEAKKAVIRKYKRHRAWICLFFVVALILAIVGGGGISYAAGIACFVLVFLLGVNISAQKIDAKAWEQKGTYVKIAIDSLLPEERVISGTFTPGVDLSIAYPVKGHDTENGYSGIFYISGETYHRFPDIKECRIPFRKEGGKKG